MRCDVIQGICHPIDTVSHVMGSLFTGVKKIISLFQSVLECIYCYCSCHYRNSKNLAGRVAAHSLSFTPQSIAGATGLRQDGSPPEHKLTASAQSPVITVTKDEPPKPSSHIAEEIPPSSILTPAETTVQPSVTALPAADQPVQDIKCTTQTSILAEPLAQSTLLSNPEPLQLSQSTEQPTLTQPSELPDVVLSKQKELFRQGIATSGDALTEWSECLKQNGIPFFIPDTATDIDLSKFDCSFSFFNQICEACYPFIRFLKLKECLWVTDSHLELISRFTQLQALDLSRCNTITDKSLLHISKLQQLRSLDITDCDLLSINKLPGLPELKSLCLRSLSHIDDLTPLWPRFPHIDYMIIV